MESMSGLPNNALEPPVDHRGPRLSVARSLWPAAQLSQLGVMRELGKFILLLGAVVIALWAGDILVDRSRSIEVVSDAPLYSLPPQDYPSSNPQVGVVKRGEHVKVTRVGYGKDLQAFHVETSSGQSGWVVLGKGIEARS